MFIDQYKTPMRYSFASAEFVQQRKMTEHSNRYLFITDPPSLFSWNNNDRLFSQISGLMQPFYQWSCEMSSKRKHGEMPSNGASFEKLDCKSNCNSHQAEDMKSGLLKRIRVGLVILQMEIDSL
jgi:hypothetical protein